MQSTGSRSAASNKHRNVNQFQERVIVGAVPQADRNGLAIQTPIDSYQERNRPPLPPMADEVPEPAPLNHSESSASSGLPNAVRLNPSGFRSDERLIKLAISGFRCIEETQACE